MSTKLSRIKRGLRFYSTRKLTNLPMIMDVDIRHETPGPETKNFFTATAVARALALSCTDSLSLKSRWVAWGGSAVSFRCSGLGYRRGTSVYYYRCREGLKEAALEQKCGVNEFEWTPGVGDGQGGLACCSPWDHKESDMTEQLNWTISIMLWH